MRHTSLFTSRFEIKYPLAPDLIPLVSRAIQRYAVSDPFVPKNQISYTVKTLYLDSQDLKYYYQKLDGLKIRKKLRIRTYGEDHSMAFLEIKRRYIDIVVKERAKYSASEIFGLIDECRENPMPDISSMHEKTGKLAGKFLYWIMKNRLQPTLLVMYEREAYIHPFAPYQRVTVDDDVRYYLYPCLDDLFHGRGVVFLKQPAGILELKFNDFMPVWMRRLEAEFDLRQMSISKYAFGIEACQEDLRKEVTACPQTHWRLYS